MDILIANPSHAEYFSRWLLKHPEIRDGISLSKGVLSVPDAALPDLVNFMAANEPKSTAMKSIVRSISRQNPAIHNPYTDAAAAQALPATTNATGFAEVSRWGAAGAPADRQFIVNRTITDLGVPRVDVLQVMPDGKKIVIESRTFKEAGEQGMKNAELMANRQLKQLSSSGNVTVRDAITGQTQFHTYGSASEVVTLPTQMADEILTAQGLAPETLSSAPTSRAVAAAEQAIIPQTSKAATAKAATSAAKAATSLPPELADMVQRGVITADEATQYAGTRSLSTAAGLRTPAMRAAEQVLSTPAAAAESLAARELGPAGLLGARELGPAGLLSATPAGPASLVGDTLLGPARYALPAAGETSTGLASLGLDAVSPRFAAAQQRLANYAAGTAGRNSISGAMQALPAATGDLALGGNALGADTLAAALGNITPFAATTAKSAAPEIATLTRQAALNQLKGVGYSPYGKLGSFLAKRPGASAAAKFLSPGEEAAVQALMGGGTKEAALEAATAAAKPGLFSAGGALGAGSMGRGLAYGLAGQLASSGLRGLLGGERDGKWDNAAEDALNWAGMGAGIGSVFPGIGTGIGALVGGGAGFLKGLVTGKDSDSTQIRKYLNDLNDSTNPRSVYNSMLQSGVTPATAGQIMSQIGLLASQAKTKAEVEQLVQSILPNIPSIAAQDLAARQAAAQRTADSKYFAQYVMPGLNSQFDTMRNDARTYAAAMQAIAPDYANKHLGNIFAAQAQQAPLAADRLISAYQGQLAALQAMAPTTTSSYYPNVLAPTAAAPLPTVNSVITPQLVGSSGLLAPLG